MARVTIGKCERCGRELQVKQEAAKAFMHLTCKCGWSGVVGEDRTYTCQICGKQRQAKTAKEKEESVCPGACQQAMHQERLKRLQERLHVGMHMREVEKLLGPPSAQTTGADALGSLFGASTSIGGSARSLSSFTQQRFAVWRRPEGEYRLVFEGDRLVQIHKIP